MASMVLQTLGILEFPGTVAEGEPTQPTSLDGSTTGSPETGDRKDGRGKLHPSEPSTLATSILDIGEDSVPLVGCRHKVVQ